MHWGDLHSFIAVDTEEFTFSSCGTVWVTRIPSSNREMRDFSKLSTGGLKWTPLLSSTRSVAKSGLLWGLQWEETRKNGDAFWDNGTQLYCSGADTKMPTGQERKAEERRTVPYRWRYETLSSEFTTNDIKTLRTLVYQRRRKCESWHIRIPKNRNLMLRTGAALRKNCRCSSNQAFSISNILLKCTFQKLYSTSPNLARYQHGSGSAEISVKTSTDFKVKGLMWVAFSFYSFPVFNF